MKDLKDLEAQYKKLGKEIEKLKAEPQPQPPFWAWFGLESHKLQRVIKIENDQALVDQDNSDMRLEDLNWCGSWSMMRFFIRLATPEEIKEHLVKLAKEKGYEGKVAKCLFEKSYKNKISFLSVIYDTVLDSLYSNGVQIYKQGKWAEIVPSLPSFEELNCDSVGVYDVHSGNSPVFSNPKVKTFIRLLAVADYLNKNTSLLFNATSYNSYSSTPQKIKEIFRHNGAEQELINFYK